MNEKLEPIHPGEILLEEYLKPLNISIVDLAKDLHVPSERISAIVNNTEGIRADTALRLAKYFSTTPKFWLNLQSNYELRLVQSTTWQTDESKVQVLSNQP